MRASIWPAHKKSRSDPRDASTSTEPRGESLELEYASSLIRVIRSRKVQDAIHSQSNTLTPPLSAPRERSVPAAESVILLSGCDKFQVGDRRRGAEKLAPLLYLPAEVQARERSLGSSMSKDESESDAERRSAAATRKYSASNARRPLADDIFGASTHGERRVGFEATPHRRPELSVLSRLRSPLTNERKQTSNAPGSAVGLARWGWHSPKKGGSPLLGRHASRMPHFTDGTFDLENAAAGVAQYIDADVVATVTISSSAMLAIQKHSMYVCMYV